jgi:hypothetical protein
MTYSEVLWRINLDGEGVAHHILDLNIVTGGGGPFISSFHSEVVLNVDSARSYNAWELEVEGTPSHIGPGFDPENNQYVLNVQEVLKTCQREPAKVRITFRERNAAKRIGNLWVYEPKFVPKFFAASTQLTFAAPAAIRGILFRIFWLRRERVWPVGPEPAQVNQAEATVSCSFREPIPSIGFAYPASRLDWISVLFGFAGGVLTSLTASFLYKLLTS